MRLSSPTQRWVRQWDKAAKLGPNTTQLALPRAIELYRLGASYKVAANVCRSEYNFYSKIDTLAEEVSGLQWERDAVLCGREDVIDAIHGSGTVAEIRKPPIQHFG